jgi:hypothetical protein
MNFEALIADAEKAHAEAKAEVVAVVFKFNALKLRVMTGDKTVTASDLQKVRAEIDFAVFKAEAHEEAARVLREREAESQAEWASEIIISEGASELSH